jgi:hypothetical protein
MSPTRKLWASVGALLGLAALLGALTLLYFLHTRPAREDEGDEVPDQLVPVGVGAAVATDVTAVRVLGPTPVGEAEDGEGTGAEPAPSETTEPATADASHAPAVETDEAPPAPPDTAAPSEATEPEAATVESGATGSEVEAVASEAEAGSTGSESTESGATASEPPSDMRQILADLVRKEGDAVSPPSPSAPTPPEGPPPDLSSNDG